MADTTSRLEYREATDADIPALVALLRAADWGDVDEATWHAWYRDLPGGPSAIMVATQGRAIVAQAEYRPSEVWIDGRREAALRAGSFALHPALRSARVRGADHPLVGLHEAARPVAVQRGARLIHAMPHRVLLPAVRHIATAHTATYRCVGLPLGPPGEPALGEVDAAEAEALWLRCGPAGRASVAVNRTAAHLCRDATGTSRLGHRDRSGDLVAVVCIRRRDGLVSDLFGRDDRAIAEALRSAQRHTSWPSPPWAHLNLLACPAMEGVLAQVDVGHVRYDFGFVVDVLAPEAAGAADPDAWFLAGGD